MTTTAHIQLRPVLSRRFLQPLIPCVCGNADAKPDPVPPAACHGNEAGSGRALFHCIAFFL